MTSFLPCPQSFSAQQDASFLMQAQASFREGAYHEAAGHFRSHLRQAPNDGDAITQYSGALLHLGESQQALNLLRKSFLKTQVKSMNLFFQGVARFQLEELALAESTWMDGAKFRDAYGERCLWALVSLMYIKRRPEKLIFWSTSYARQFPKGKFAGSIKKLRSDASKGQWHQVIDDSLLGRTATELRVMHHENKWFSFPHFYSINLGSINTLGVKAQPASGPDIGTRVIVDSPFVEYVLHGDLTIGAGPFLRNDYVAEAWYRYSHDWYSDDTRFNIFLQNSELIDYLLYFPFRADVLERGHHIGGSFFRDFLNGLSMGAKAELGLQVLGSSLIPSPEGDEIEEKSSFYSNTQRLSPFLRFRYKEGWESKLTLLFDKKVYSGQPELSHKTYQLFDGEQLFSFDFEQTIQPLTNWGLFTEVFYYDWVFNDYWLDRSSIGVFLGSDFRWARNWLLEGGFGFANHSYILSIPSQALCGKSGSFGDSTTPPEQCKRNATGLYGVLRFSWERNLFQAFGTSLTYQSLKTQNLREYNESRISLAFTFLYTFPSVKEYRKRTKEPFSRQLTRPSIK